MKEENLIVNLYPYPNNGTFILVYDTKVDAELTIYDMSGRTLLKRNLSKDNTQLQISINEKSGIYIYQIIDEKGNSKTGKFVIR